MSGPTREWVWEHSTSRGTARLVLLSIADRVVDEQCIAWASLSSLAKRTRASKSTVQAALVKLLSSDELEQVDGFTGPLRSTVYRLPLAAKQLSAGRAQDVTPAPGDDRLSALKRLGIRPREEPILAATYRNPDGPIPGTPVRDPVPRSTESRHTGVPDPGTQNRKEPNRRYNSSADAPTTADRWQVDAVARGWALRQGHLERLGEEGLAAADAKWRAHRATWGNRPATFWAADWRQWIAREHAPTSHGKRNVSSKTRAEAHTDALLAALAAADELE
ncbi:helix-turn-helix domain-containing protein [Streptomyces sp. P38-E01]|uniref:Helix-turn-helix domain-containing protein n=1 Tax=Streptomyces tardus TaxID=2780544 RepID=A0A949N6C8_9ACTN|nr:helix-turn-helix domain-containing protein [Streptomyces tardus]MBU7598927.1 helix-turn-helix domain-containing protein [Streptomyces tardus]